MKLLASAGGAGDEVLCSWNGSQDGESVIQPPGGGPSFRIAAKVPYHVATNMNAPAEQARRDVLFLLNDEPVLDFCSLDNALQILESHDGAGLVGGEQLLRTPKGLLGHAVVLLTASHAYNRLRPERLGSLLQASGLEPQQSGPIPAVTGALVRAEDPSLEVLNARWASEEADVLEQLLQRSQGVSGTAAGKSCQRCTRGGCTPEPGMPTPALQRKSSADIRAMDREDETCFRNSQHQRHSRSPINKRTL